MDKYELGNLENYKPTFAIIYIACQDLLYNNSHEAAQDILVLLKCFVHVLLST